MCMVLKCVSASVSVVLSVQIAQNLMFLSAKSQSNLKSLWVAGLFRLLCSHGSNDERVVACCCPLEPNVRLFVL